MSEAQMNERDSTREHSVHPKSSDEQRIDERLDAELNDPDAILEVMAVTGVNEATAREVWHSFINTIRKSRNTTR